MKPITRAILLGLLCSAAPAVWVLVLIVGPDALNHPVLLRAMAVCALWCWPLGTLVFWLPTWRERERR